MDPDASHLSAIVNKLNSVIRHPTDKSYYLCSLVKSTSDPRKKIRLSIFQFDSIKKIVPKKTGRPQKQIRITDAVYKKENGRKDLGPCAKGPKRNNSPDAIILMIEVISMSNNKRFENSLPTVGTRTGAKKGRTRPTS